MRTAPGEADKIVQHARVSNREIAQTGPFYINSTNTR